MSNNPKNPFSGIPAALYIIVGLFAAIAIVATLVYKREQEKRQALSITWKSAPALLTTAQLTSPAKETQVESSIRMAQPVENSYQLKMITSLQELETLKAAAASKDHFSEEVDAEVSDASSEIVPQAQGEGATQDALILPSKKLIKIRDARRRSDRGRGFATGGSGGSAVGNSWN